MTAYQKYKTHSKKQQWKQKGLRESTLTIRLMFNSYLIYAIYNYNTSCERLEINCMIVEKTSSGKPNQ